MKKTISIILCIAMILSSVAMCLPAMAAPIDFGVEQTTQDFANVPQEDEAELASNVTFPITVNFDDGVNPFTASNATMLTLKAENGVLAATMQKASGAIARAVYSVGAVEAGRYKVSFDIELSEAMTASSAREVRLYLNSESTAQKELQIPVGETTANFDATIDFATAQNALDLKLCVVRLKRNDPAETFYIDNFKVEQLPTPGEIVFDANGGTGTQEPMAVQTGLGYDLPVNTTFERDYYDFVGWGIEADASANDVIESYSVELSAYDANKQITIYAIWVRRTFNVELNLGDGITEMETTYAANEGEDLEITLPTAAQVENGDYLLTGFRGVDETLYAPGATVVFRAGDILTAEYMDISGYGMMTATASGHNGATANVDMRYPAAYYVFTEALAEDTISLAALGLPGASAVEYDAQAKTLIVYPAAKTAVAGATYSYPEAKTSLMNADKTKVVTLPAVSYTLAAYTGYENMIPYGDAEGTYVPYYTDNSAEVVVNTEGDNTYVSLRGVAPVDSGVYTGSVAYFENGATYKFTGMYKVDGVQGNPGAAAGAVHFNAAWTGNETTGALNNLSNGYDHTADLVDSANWHGYSVEFTVDKTSEADNNMVSIYSDAVSQAVTEYSVDNFALYKRIDLDFANGLYTQLKTGEEAVTVGAYLCDEVTTVTVPASPYEVRPDYAARLSINAEKPWVDGNGNAYAVGDTIDLAETGPLTLSPNIQTSEKTYTVEFVGAGISGLPGAVKVLAGDTIDLAAINAGLTIADAGKHVSGWSATGEKVVFGQEGFYDTEITVDKNTVLTAMVNHDINYAYMTAEEIEAAYSDSINGTAAKNGDFLKFTASGLDHGLVVSNLNIPVNPYKNVYMILDVNYTNGANYTFNMGDTTEGIYFARTEDQSADSADRQLRGVVGQIINDAAGTPTYARIDFEAAANSYWNGTLDTLRFDRNDGSHVYNVRYIQFAEAEEFDEKNIAVEGLDAPVTGMYPDTVVTDPNGMFDVQSITWTPSHFVQGRFDEGMNYTVELKLVPKSGSAKKFAADSTATLNGEPIDVSIDAEGVATIVKSYPATNLYLLFEMAINGPASISRAGRITQYSAVIDGNIPDKTVSWSVNDKRLASVNEDGKVLPAADGTLILTATSNYNPKISVEYEVEISNQAPGVELVYHAGTTDEVSNMPENEAEVSGPYDLSTIIPVREGCLFKGWAVSDESIETVKTINANLANATRTYMDGDVEKGIIDVYAIWQTGEFFEFNDESDLAYVSPKYNVSDPYIKDGYYTFDTTGGDSQFIVRPQNTNGDLCKTIEIRVATTLGGTISNVIFYATKDQNGYVVPPWGQSSAGNDLYAATATSTAYTASEDLETYVTFQIKPDKASWANTIAEIRFDPVNGGTGNTFRYDYIRFLQDVMTIEFNANTTDEVTGMPESTKASQGAKFTISETPVREGYNFVGWSKYPDQFHNVNTSFTITDDTVFYAVWEEAVDHAGELNISADTEALLVKVNGGKGEKVVLSFNNPEGRPVELKATVNNGDYAVLDLSSIDYPITGAVLTTEDEQLMESIASIKLTTLEDAIATAEKVTVSTDDESGYATEEHTNYKFNNNTTDVVSDGTLYEVGADSTNNVYNVSSSEGAFIFNFENEYEEKFADMLTNMDVKSFENSIMSIEVNDKTTAAPSLFTPELQLAAATHPYIVIKARQTGFITPSLDVYFSTDGKWSSQNAVSATIGSDWTMAVYNMAENENWAGTVQRLFLGAKSGTTGELEIDWILFTDTVPAGLDAIAGTTEIYPVINAAEMAFTDVAKGQWYYSEIFESYRRGFVTGITETLYDPDGFVTIAEAITLAVRLNYIYKGKTLPAIAEGEEWYTPFVEAAIEEKIIKADQYAQYDVPALRKEVAHIMANALPDEMYERRNMFNEVPDMTRRDKAYSSVLKLYNAGVLHGSDDLYNFYPESYINRAEMAAIVNRTAIEKNRKRVITQAEIDSKTLTFDASDIVKGGRLLNCSSANFVMKNGAAWTEAIITGDGRMDPLVYFDGVTGSFDGGEYSKLVIAIKTPHLPNGRLYFVTPNGNWSEDRAYWPETTEVDPEDESIRIMTYNLEANSLFDDTITNMRFDPFNAAGEWGLLYIKLIPRG